MGNDIAAFIDRHAVEWNRHDAETLCQHHSENGLVISPMFATVQGRPQICRTYVALFEAFPDWRLQFGPPIIDAYRVAISFSVRATQQGEFMGLAGTGRSCEIEGVSLFEFDSDFRIREERRVYDFTGLLARLGVLKVKPGV